jgi:cell division protein FtsW (lipid II flippase)
MTVSYVPALERDVRHTRLLVRQLDARHALLPLTSVVAILAIGLAYSGRTRASEYPALAPSSVALVNLNAVTDAKTLEAPLGLLFADQADREFAASVLFQFVQRLRPAGDLPNIGAIARATVSADAIARTPSLVVYAERLRAARDRSALPLFTAEDLTNLKPLLTVRTAETFARSTMAYTAVYVAAFYLVLLLWWVRVVRGDPLLLAAAHFLTAVGFALLLSRQDPLRDTMLFARYTETVLLGLAVMAAVSLVNFRRAAFLRFSYLPLLAALTLSVLLMLFGSGPGTSSAKVNLGPVQPIEATRLLLALFLAGYFARRWELLRQVDSDSVGQYRVPRWLTFPRLSYVLPVLAGVGTALLFFFLQKDLGPALFLSCVFLAMYASARGRVGMAIAGFAVLVAGFYIGYVLNISDTLVGRIRMWQSPWDNGVRGGDQVAQSVWALATGGFFGTGLGFGDTRYLPAGHTDLVLAAIGEELGAAGLIAVAAVYALVAWRGFRIGLTAANDYAFFLATAVTLFLIVPTLVMAAGMLGLTPLTGVVTPFMSYGGSAMVANFAALGMLVSMRAHATSRETSEPFKKPTRYLGATLAAAALVLIAFILNVQLVHADDYVVRPHVGFQADGVRRYQYNPRILDVVRLIPRGTIYDRSGLPLASSDEALLQKSQAEYTKLGLGSNATCDEPIERCYPLGGATFHLLGDATTHLNWSATNSSYIERDAHDRLRGFEDHATAIELRDAAGHPTVAVRRDYRELVPFLRHRHDPHHPAVLAILNRKRDLHLTIDAQLQLQVAAIVATAAKKSLAGKAAAVVLDADTGELLAAVSYPLPVLTRYQNENAPTDSDALLDRARYGLYPPGSTFKLVTAAAALRQDSAANRDTFTCSLLPDGRVGAHMRGWTRPVRDDVLDKHPHGTIDMHSAVVRSCNAYFAQLAMRVGAKALLDTATRLGISVAQSGSVRRLQGTLPQAGYGQGDVVASPLRMARAVAAIASGGVLHDVQLERAGPASAKSDVFLPPLGAALLAGYMRDAVLDGTGRTLKSNPWRIAGKTGTAEIAGQPSHAWFVGFAPFGPAKKKIAVAVIIEHAGYGGRAAAPIAGEIVSAAAAAGLIY